jgi:hypothetical protein
MSLSINAESLPTESYKFVKNGPIATAVGPFLFADSDSVKAQKHLTDTLIRMVCIFRINKQRLAICFLE